MRERKKLKISFNSPVVLGFALLCVLVQLVNLLTDGASNRLLFSVYRSYLGDPLTSLRCITHVFGHADWSHLLGNMMYLLILGPMLEEKYGSGSIAFVMLATALVTGVANLLLFPYVRLLGASCIVFAFILLASITTTEEHAIPASFLLVALMYIGQQLYEGVFAADNISQLSHILGGAVGSVFGFSMNKIKTKRYERGRHV